MVTLKKNEEGDSARDSTNDKGRQRNMESVPSGCRKAIEELVRGRDFANQLRHVINGDDWSGSATPFAEDLLSQVLRSFTNTLLLLSNTTSQSREASPLQPGDSSCWINPAKSEDSQESCKSSIIRDKRGCYKRRRTSETWEKEAEAPIEDGRQWRKYGQKVILNAKYPRNYYRCTHKNDQGCLATKQVQRVQEDPPLFRNTYYGNHTCKNLLNPEIILDSGSPSDSSVFLSFDNSLPSSAKQDCPFFSSSLPSSSSVKKQCKEEIPSSSSNDYRLSSELTFDNSSRHVTFSSTLESDDKDVISGVLCDFSELGDVFEPFC